MYGYDDEDDNGWGDVQGEDDDNYNAALIDDELQIETKKTDFHMIHGDEI